MTKEEIINKLKHGDKIETADGIGVVKRIVGFHETRYEAKKMVWAIFGKQLKMVPLDDIITIVEDNESTEITEEQTV